MQLPVSKKSNFKNELHFAVVPLGASNERRLAAPDTATNPHFKNYSYSGGAEMKYLTAFNFRGDSLQQSIIFIGFIIM